ncbi:DNA repair protein RecO [Legionella worsleiensis]|uniref:DNA repair protein RecO n=1 Tax=Legionella worsleiensis TaxID=45076 RepID=A0A0W1A989_9GAMM|nr:DNA repair protein RecO [Legionella worsleiensis]KTD77851.1 DNA repair protein recO [Legionella worsleiensis]STY33093.1 DNA repair protein RecO (recombination protein O) [Legionella worsleiensis]
MTTKSLQAWVIHKQWSGDTSARVHFFSRELGLVHSLCKGARTLKKLPLLQPFTPLWVSVDERHDRYYTQSMESVSPMLPLEGHALFSGLYVNELLYHVLRPLYPDPNLFDAYLTTLNGLAMAADRMTIESILRRFEWALLDSCGHSFSWIHEARTGSLVRPECQYQFIAGEGFVVSAQGIPGEHILALAEDNLNDASCLKSAKRVMRLAIDHLLGGREIKARALYSCSTP